MSDKVIVIGAGIGGLAAGLRLSHAGCCVTVIDAQPGPGGKMRTLPSAAGPVDAGPTVLTMKPVFENLFADVGETLSDHLTLRPLATLARHYWSDGTVLDLSADADVSAAQITDTFGKKAADQFRAFSARALRLFDTFDAPMMRSAAPSQLAMASHVLKRPRIIADMALHQTLFALLRDCFDDPKLAQLFGRYATYVGGSPYASPAILSLIWHAEAAGVWAVEGGMHQLAQTLVRLAEARGAVFHYTTPALQIVRQNGRVAGVETPAGFMPADTVVFNGDPRALSTGLLGEATRGLLPKTATDPRSLSADVMAFAARPSGLPLAHHTVFFADDPMAEFAPIAAGRRPDDATLYLCAQDHGQVAQDALQRFEIIRNAPAGLHATEKENSQCQTLICDRLRHFGLSLDPAPQTGCLTTPQGFADLFPASLGALYGRSPHGMMAAFKRPTARTKLPGLYLCGGGTHPGAGVPMATLSGQHAAAAILTDRTSTLTSRQTATPGGMSTGSAHAAPKPSRS